MFIDLLFFRLVAVAFRLIVPTTDAEALQRIAPEPISLELARDNIAAARIAAFVVFPDHPTLMMADDLLAIARRESHFQPTAKTTETGGRVSCGPMTPTPIASCAPASIVDGYIAGAIHLREWVDGTRSRYGGPQYSRAMLGFAGGFALIRRCDRGAVIVDRKGVKIDLCKTAERTFYWSHRIRTERWLAAS